MVALSTRKTLLSRTASREQANERLNSVREPVGVPFEEIAANEQGRSILRHPKTVDRPLDDLNTSLPVAVDQGCGGKGVTRFTTNAC